jgi:hypothetical protein
LQQNTARSEVAKSKVSPQKQYKMSFGKKQKNGGRLALKQVCRHILSPPKKMGRHFG